MTQATDDDLDEAPEGSKAKEDRHFVTALARGLDVLDCFRSADRMLGNQDIAKRCKLPKSTISRLTYTLTKLGYLDYVEDSGKYRLGTATLALGSSMLARMDIRQIARPLMQDVADATGTTVGLCSRDRLSMIYVENARSASAITLSLDVGSRIPIATTSAGRAYLAALGERERDEILDRIQDLDEIAWPKIRDGIEKGIRDYRELGCTCSFGEWQKDVNAIAVTINPGGGRAPMAINCGGPSFLLSIDFLLNDAKPRLLEIARRIEAATGGVRY